MRSPIRNEDLKTLFGGIAAAAASGLLMGAALCPNLDEGRIEGPQILLAGGGPRGEAHGAEVGLAAYRGRLPDYVVGSDSLKSPQYAVLAYDERAGPELADTGEPAEATADEPLPEIHPARWTDEPREPPRYPSLAGNAIREIDLPPPPEPPGAEDEAPLAD